MSPAEVLGLDAAAAADPAEVRKAYARLLKLHRPDRDPEGFRRIRDAYEALTAPAGSGGAGPAAEPAGAPRPGAPSPAGPPPPPARPAEGAGRPSPAAGSTQAQHRAPQPLRLLQAGDWDALGRLAEERLDGSPPTAARTDLDLARCLALVEPEQAFQLAQRAFESDRDAVDPWMEAMLAAGMELSAFPLADRRAAAAAALEALPPGDDPETAKRLRVMACQVAHVGLRTTLTAAAAKLDHTAFRRQQGELEQRRDEDEGRDRRRQILGAVLLLTLAGAIAGIVSQCRSTPAHEPVPVAPPPFPVVPLVPTAPTASGQRIQTPQAAAERIHERVREALETGNIALAASAFRAPARVGDAAEPVLADALRRVLSDASINLDPRLRLARKLDQTAGPALRQVIADVLPEAVDPARPAR